MQAFPLTLWNVFSVLSSTRSILFSFFRFSLHTRIHLFPSESNYVNGRPSQSFIFHLTALQSILSLQISCITSPCKSISISISLPPHPSVLHSLPTPTPLMCLLVSVHLPMFHFFFLTFSYYSFCFSTRFLFPINLVHTSSFVNNIVHVVN